MRLYLFSRSKKSSYVDSCVQKFVFYWFFVLGCGYYPLPKHSNALFSPCTWYCKYIYFTKLDQVEPLPEDYFFRSLERGKFTRRRLGYKKFGSFWKGAVMITTQKIFQVCFLVQICRFYCLRHSGCRWCNVCTYATSWSLGQCKCCQSVRC